MKVLLITHSFAEVTHGPAKFAQLLYEYAQTGDSELELHILTEKPLDKPRINAIKVQPPRVFQAFIKLIRSWKYWRRARKMNADTPFDILIFNDAITAFFAALLLGPEVKVVGMLNDSAYIHPCFPEDQAFRKKAIKFFYHLIEKKTVQYADWTICCSRFLQKKTQEAYQTPKVSYLYQGVNLDAFLRKKVDYTITSVIKIRFVKNDYRTGGLKYLLLALAILDTYQFELQIIGPLAIDKEKILQLSFAANTKLLFAGALPQEQVFEQMANADLLCIPSLHEGLGVANIEALAIGLPVVSTRVGGIVEVLQNGRLGWLANPADANDLAQQIAACINALPEERRQRAILGRTQVEEKFTHQQMLTQLLTSLHQV